MRIDSFLVKKGFFDSRTKAKQAIERGEVFIVGKNYNKPSYEIDPSLEYDIEIKGESHYVSLGGYKMEKGLKDFAFSVKGLVAADVGASTGGFTDCLLQNGARKVYAVDLNDGLLHSSLSGNGAVVPIIKNARCLSENDFDDKIDLIVADLSFISATYVLPVFSKILEEEKNLIVLVKPQFEAGEKINCKNGIIREKKLQFSACKKVIDCAIRCGFTPIKITTAPVNEKKNLEFLMLFNKGGQNSLDINEYFSSL